MCLACLAGCSSGDEVGPAKQKLDVELVPCMTAYEDVESAADKKQKPATDKGLSRETPTRAWLPPSGFELVPGTENNSIGICFTQDGEAPKTGYFFTSSGKWRSSVEIASAATYYLYGYTPHVPGVSCEISSSGTPGDNSAYSEGAVLTIKDISTVTPNDVCVVVGAKNGMADYTESGDYEVTGLQEGNFEYAAVPTGVINEPGVGNYAYLLFDHLFSALRLNFSVNATYAALRNIKLTELSLRTYTDPSDPESVNTKTFNVTITLQKTADGSSPIAKDGLGNELITFTPTGEKDYKGTPFYQNPDGEELPVSPAFDTFVAHYVPVGVTKLVLISKYDVYDRNVTTEHPDGNLIRKDCIAENTINLSMFSGQSQSLRGRRYNINLTVNPSYLYVMSDDDLNNPKLDIN